MDASAITIVPSQVREAILSNFPHVRTAKNGDQMYSSEFAGRLRAIVELTDSIPLQLLPTGQNYVSMITERSNIQEMLARWAAKSGDTLARDPVWKIYHALINCPDEWPPPVHAELPFIPDVDLRLSIARDIGAAERAAIACEWKVATVMSGSATEALLLWSIQQIEGTDPAKIASARAGLKRNAKTRLDDLSLADLAAIARDLKLIEQLTWNAVDLAREYRNLIHPGRAQRNSIVCDRATALAALSGAAHVVRDLSKP